MPGTGADPRRRNEQSRCAILDASLTLISELGYDNVSIEAIAKRACVSKATIYRWWPSKGAVFLEAATRSLDPVVAFPDTGDIVEDIRVQLRRTLEIVTATGFGTAYRGLIAAGQSDPSLMQAVFDQIINPNIEAYSARIALARERNEIRAEVDVRTLRDLLYGVIEYRLLHAMPIEMRHVDAAIKIVSDGIR